MIDGITVLSQSDIYANPNWMTIVAISSIILILICIIVGLITLNDIFMWFLGVIAIIELCMIIFAATGTFDIDTGRDSYKCTIEDYVSINDIYDYYDVVERDGDLWVLEDKKND